MSISQKNHQPIMNDSHSEVRMHRNGSGNTEKQSYSKISYHNKDITAKIFGESLKEKSFAVLGTPLPKIIRVLPTNLPAIEANELRLDNLFLLEDGSLALVDYESTYLDANKIKYLNYVIRTLKRNFQQGFPIRKIRMIVIYTADIAPDETTSKLDIGCLQFELEEIFLLTLDSQALETQLAQKIHIHLPLSDEEQMLFIILPLTYKGKKSKQECIRRCFQLAKEITDEKVQTFLLSGILVFTDKVINQESAKQMEDWIMLLKVEKLFEERRLAYGEEQAKKATKRATKKNSKDIAKVMLAKGFTPDDIADIIKTLSLDEIKKLETAVSKS